MNLKRHLKKEWKKLIGVMLCCVVLVLLVTSSEEKYQVYFKTINVSKKNVKTILMYTPLFNSMPWNQAPYDYKFTHRDGIPCEERSCQITYNRYYVSKSDAVVFHARDMTNLSPSYMKQLRRQNINNKWIWLMHENPYYTLMSYNEWDDIFNWTVTYRPSSDVFMPYYDILKYRSTDHPPKAGTNFAKGKTRKCLYINSHCDDFRMGLIKNLRKYIDVDVLGGCRNVANPELKLDCPRKSVKCWNLQQEYKFYLAFENNFCEDYVTEKYYMNGLKHNLVPIVLGGGNFNDRRVALPHSSINLLDFKDMKSLADYLNYLDKNDTAYNEYHEWRYNHRINNSINFMCGVCKLLWKQDKQQKISTVKLTEFWSTKTCKSYDENIFQKYLK